MQYKCNQKQIKLKKKKQKYIYNIYNNIILYFFYNIILYYLNFTKLSIFLFEKTLKFNSIFKKIYI